MLISSRAVTFPGPRLISRGTPSRGSERSVRWISLLFPEAPITAAAKSRRNWRQNLGYRCISRDILLEASEEFNIPEIKLIRAIQDAPSILNRLTRQKEKYVAYIRTALLKQVQKDNLVYHGLFGHFFLQDIPHVLKVRIVADLEARVADEVKREGISPAKAREIIVKDDEERRKWALYLYGADWWDATLYDLVIHLKTITVDNAVDLLYHLVQLPGFQTTPESQAAINSLVEAARMEAAPVWWEGAKKNK